MAHLPAPPPSLKSVSHFLKVAVEHDTRDPVIAYWARVHATQKSLQLDKSSPEAKAFLIATLDWLETFKKTHANNEAITNEMIGQAHVENYAIKLFNFADEMDRKSVFNKNVVKAFYTAGYLIDVLENFGALGEDFEKMRKYAKWKAAYIHNCLKNGETPISGGTDDMERPGDGVEDGNDEKQDTQWPQEPPPAQWGQPQDPQGSNSQWPQHHPPAQVQNSQWPPQEPLTSGSNVPPSKIVDIPLAQKHIKFAQSALNFDDIPSAVSNLKTALALLE